MKRSLALIAACLALAGNAHAVGGYLFGDSTFDPLNKLGDSQIVDSGWYGDTGVHWVDNTNYIVGACSVCVQFGVPEFYRNWFVIDLAGFTAPVTTLTLTLYSFDVTSAGTYTLWDVTRGDIALLPLESTDRTDIYADLGTGTPYGSFSYQLGDANGYRTLELNSDGLADLNDAIEHHYAQWAIGGSFEPTAPIPEPETYALMLAGLGLVGWMARRRKA